MQENLISRLMRKKFIKLSIKIDEIKQSFKIKQFNQDFLRISEIFSVINLNISECSDFESTVSLSFVRDDDLERCRSFDDDFLD